MILTVGYQNKNGTSLKAKAWKIMKLTIAFLLFFTFQVCAKGYTQKINMVKKHAPLSEVFKAIEQQTGFLFFYDKDLIQKADSIDITLKNASLEEALSVCLKDQQLTYTIVKNTIVIQPENTFLPVVRNIVTNIDAEPPPIEIHGRVLDQKGVPIQNVSVLIAGTKIGTTTDNDGRFTLTSTDNRNIVLEISSIGYQTKTIKLGKQTEIIVTLEQDITGMSDVVVVGYGTQKKINLTGAIDVVSGEELANRPARNVALLLQGTAPSLNITIGGRGGEPGARPDINIRGIGTISGNGSPLILVDGVEMDINDLNPEDIESVSVLKDAAASAIYGSRAPFGVVLITTKKGEKNQPPSIQYNNEFDYSNPIDLPRFVDALSWATAYNQATVNGGLAPVYPDQQIERIKGYMAGTYPNEYNVDNPPTSQWRGRWQGNANYNWPSLYYKKNAFSQKHNINVRGGNEKMQYYLSGNYFDQEGLYNWRNDTYKRYNAIANISAQVTPWIRFDFNTKYSRRETDRVMALVGYTDTYIWNSMITFAPITPYHNVDGTVSNPLVAYLQGTGMNKEITNDSWITLATELEPLKGWKTRISYNYNNQAYSQVQNPKRVPVNIPNGNIGNVGFSGDGYNESLSQTSYSLANVVTSYEKTMDKHYFKVLMGYEQEANFYRNLFGSRYGLITEQVPSISTATDLGSTQLGDAISHWSNQGIFGRLNYNYKEKYLIEFDARYNGSSRFAHDSRWGFFPSASAGYNISKENFWKSVGKYVNTLKLRASYGALGNQNVANYLYLPTLPVYSNLNYLINGERPIYAGIPNIITNGLTWETITTLNFGVDAGFLKNRLDLNFDWYNRVTSDMLGPAEELPAVLGTSAPAANNAKLSTKGFEITLAWKDRISSNFYYNVGLIFGDNITKVLEYKNDNKLIDTYYPGKVLGEVWGYTTGKIMQTDQDVASLADQTKFFNKWFPGDIAYQDLNKDGIINDGNRTLDDHGDLTRIANENPRYNYGITAGFTWKAFTFNIFGQGIGKRDFVPDVNSHMFWGFNRGGSPGSESTLLKNGWMMDYWRPADEKNILGSNTGAYFPRPSFDRNEAIKNHQIQTRYIVSAAYFRLKSIQIGYTVPQHIIKKVSLQRARIYFSGTDLLTFKKLPKDIDPELSMTAGGSGYFYPLSSTYSFGVNLTF